MTIEVLAFTPGHKDPLTLDDYADYLMAVVACGTYTESFSIPDQLTYDNPVTGSKLSIGEN